jgi:PAS domain S-box-containing protein
MKILHLEDNPVDAQQVFDTFVAAGLAAEIIRVETRAAFDAALRAAVAEGGLDLVLARYWLAALSGLEALALAHALCPGVPFIFVAAAVAQERLIEAVRQGATDYVLKTDLERLPLAVQRALRESEERAARQRAEAQAAAERERLQVTLGSIGDGVITAGTDGHITYVNPVAETITGWPQAEALGQPIERIFDIVDEATHRPVDNPVRRVLSSGALAGLANHTVLVRRDGSNLPIDDSSAPIRDPQGRLIGVVVIFRDITHRRAAEQALSDSEDRFRNLVTATSAVVWTTGPDGDFIAPQPSWEAYTGQPWEEHRGWGWLAMIHPADRAGIEARWKAALSGTAPYESHGRLWNAEGREYCYFASRGVPLLRQDGSVREWIGAIDDVHQRELARLAARESEGRFRILADTAPVLVWMARPDGGVEFVNETWVSFTGRSLEQELGDGWAAAVHAEDYERCLGTYRGAIEQRRPFQQEYRLRRHDGQYRWMLDSGVPRTAAGGAFAGFIGSLVDIHERKADEETLRNRARQQAELANLGRRALAEMDLPALIDEVTRVVTRTLGAEFCEVLEAQPDGRALRLVAGQGWQPGKVGVELVSGGAQSMAGFTLLANAPVVVEDLPRENRFHPPALLLEHNTVSGITAIIPGEAAAWGVLGVFSAQRRLFDADDANFLQNVGNMLADAIVRARSEAELRVAHDQTVAILEGVAEGVTVQGRDSQLVFANDTAARLLGYPGAAELIAAQPGEILGQYEILDELGAPVPPERLPGRRALLGERNPQLTVRFRVRATGEEHWAHDRAQPVFNSQGQVVLAVSVFHDITDLKRAEITQRLLAEAGALLARDLDTQDLLRGLARLLVPVMSDYTIIYQLDHDFGVRATGAYHADPAQARALHALVEYTQANRDPNSPVRQALLRQEPVLMSGIDVPTAIKNLGPAHAHLADLMPHGMLLVPLVARQRLNGLLLLARTTTPQPFTSFDQALVQELARRAALALDNSELYTGSQRLNSELEERVRERTAALNVAVEQLQENNLALGVEISERQAAEERFRSLLQAAPDATIIVNGQGVILMANQHASVVFGYANAELVGQGVELLLPKAMKARYRQQRRAYMRAPDFRSMGEGLDIYGRRQDGSLFPAEVSLSPLQTPDGVLVTASVRDITQRKLAEEALRQSERQLAQAQQMARVGSWRWDVASDRLAWSDVLCEIHGLEPPQPPMPFAEFLDHIHPADRARVSAVIGAARRAGIPFEYEHRIRRADGAERALYSRGEVLRAADGEPLVISAITQDLSERQAIENELRSSREQLRQLSSHLQAAREEERARMSREIHDELGGTLTGLKMDVARLAKNADTVTPAELRERALNISALIDSTVQTVRRIASDLRPGILDDFGLAAAIEWQLQEFCTRAGLEYDYEANTDELNLDPASSTALFRLFQETLTNVARHAQATRVTAQLEITDHELLLEVRDNGRGISTGEIGNSKSLGLLGMRERVQQLNGQLSITGAPGQGTTVLIRVPLTGDQTAPRAMDGA